ncbi:MAG: NADH-quinone oxidoreductase subunit C [Methanophagales archaeon]|nr:NADH-quinone oxidoreductase subunit C [Methanophagales archaeon]
MSSTRSAEEVHEEFRKNFGEEILHSYLQSRKVGKKERELKRVWIRISRAKFKDAVRFISKIQDSPHLCTITGQDLDEEIELIYHFSIFYGEPSKEIKVMIATRAPKNDLKFETITDIIPGAILYEREQQDMLGVKIENIPDSRRVILPEDFPDGLYPLRLDNNGISDGDKLVKYGKKW